MSSRMSQRELTHLSNSLALCPTQASDFYETRALSFSAKIIFPLTVVDHILFGVLSYIVIVPFTAMFSFHYEEYRENNAIHLGGWEKM